MEGLDEDAVDLRPTLSNEDEEPEVLPAAFPNLLANGASGIAVGMATSIPPHNVGEICEALQHLIRHPKARPDTLVQMIPGPDFPTGGVLVEPRENILDAYTTGKGGFRLRANWHAEDQGRGQYQIVVTEIPYQVQKSKLVERIADLINAKKIPILADVRDESAEDIRLMLEPKSRTVDPNLLMETTVQALGPGGANSPEHERADRRANAQSLSACARCCGPFSTTAARCCCAGPGTGWTRSRTGLEVSGGLYHRLPQPRPCDRDHPDRGRAQTRPDCRRLGRRRAPDRRAGRGDPEHAPAVACAGWRRWNCGTERDTDLLEEQAELFRTGGEDEDLQWGKASPTRSSEIR